MSDYMKTDAKLLPYLPFPRFLLGADLTQTGYLTASFLAIRGPTFWLSGSQFSVHQTVNFLAVWLTIPPFPAGGRPDADCQGAVRRPAGQVKPHVLG